MKLMLLFIDFDLEI